MKDGTTQIEFIENGSVTSPAGFLAAGVVAGFKKSKKSDLTAIKSCIKVARENGSICIFPEGNRTVTGKLGNVDKSIVKLAKSLKKPLVFVNIKGGFGTEPRWGNNVRKGKMECVIRNIIPYDEFKDLDNDELYDIIIENLTVNDLEFYDQFKCKNSAMYLERVLFACPVCGAKHKLTSNQNILKCNDCLFLKKSRVSSSVIQRKLL